MKCPLKFRLQAFEGGDECDPECAWLVEVHECSAEPITLCAIALTGSPMDCPRKVLNNFVSSPSDEPTREVFGNYVVERRDA